MSRFFKHLSIVFRKELVDAIRDRRSLISTLIYPLVGPVMIIIMMQAMADMHREAEQIRVPIDGKSNAADLVTWLENEGVEFVDAPSDFNQAILSGEIPMVLAISSEFKNEMKSAQPAMVKIFADGSRNDTRSQVARINSLIHRYSGTLMAKRLLARGINPIVTQPIAIENVEVASEQKLAARLLAMIPMFIVIAAFVTGMQVAVDTTAGERERGSLEFLLLQPVSRQAIVIGKWLAATSFACMGTMLTLATCLGALHWLPFNEFGFHIELTSKAIIGLAVISLPLTFFASGLQILVSSFARSFKEAQSYLAAILFLPMIPGLINMIYPIDNTFWITSTPILAQQMLLSRTLAGDFPGILDVFWCSTIALLGGYFCVVLTARLFQRETIIFGR